MRNSIGEPSKHMKRPLTGRTTKGKIERIGKHLGKLSPVENVN